MVPRYMPIDNLGYNLIGSTDTGEMALFKLPQTAPSKSKALECKEMISSGHDAGRVQLYVFHEWLLSFAQDGIVIYRHFKDPLTVMILNAHDAIFSQVKAVSVRNEGQDFITLGMDGVFKIWKWNLNNSGKKKIAELIKDTETMQYVKEEAKTSLLTEISNLVR
jgi:hypothetical protein